MPLDVQAWMEDAASRVWLSRARDDVWEGVQLVHRTDAEVQALLFCTRLAAGRKRDPA